MARFIWVQESILKTAAAFPLVASEPNFGKMWPCCLVAHDIADDSANATNH